MEGLTVKCPVVRPVYGVLVMAPVQTESGLSIVGGKNQGMQMVPQIHQTSENHHELRVLPQSSYEATPLGPVTMLYCVYCAQAGSGWDWQETLKAYKADD